VQGESIDATSVLGFGINVVVTHIRVPNTSNLWVFMSHTSLSVCSCRFQDPGYSESSTTTTTTTTTIIIIIIIQFTICGPG